MANLGKGPWEEMALFDADAYKAEEIKEIWDHWRMECGQHHPIIAGAPLTDKNEEIISKAISQAGLDAVRGAISAAAKNPVNLGKNKDKRPKLRLGQILNPPWLEYHTKAWRESPEQKFINE